MNDLFVRAGSPVHWRRSSAANSALNGARRRGAAHLEWVYAPDGRWLNGSTTP
jgi:hypothetical protein